MNNNIKTENNATIPHHICSTILTKIIFKVHCVERAKTSKGGDFYWKNDKMK